MKYPKCKIVVASFLILIAIQILFNPVSSTQHWLMISNVRSELPQTRAKWDALNITDYTFEIQGNSPLICQPSAVVEVRDDVVVKVVVKNENNEGQVLPLEKWEDPDWKDENFLCSYYHFTMVQIFDFLELTLEKHPSTIMKVDFDLEYGFVASFNYGIYTGYGLLRPQISECCSYFSIKNFHPLK